MAFKDEKYSATQPFLGKTDDDDDDDKHETTSASSPRLLPPNFHLRDWPYYWILHFILFSLYTFGVFLLGSRAPTDKAQSELLPLPAREAIKWELRPFKTALVNNSFSGDPRPELDRAWHEMLTNDNIRLPIDNLQALDVKSIYLKNGQEAVTSLSVFHSLHCLKKVRRMVHRDYYHKDKDESAMVREKNHVDHCLEYLREALMCKPDLSLISFHWINNTAQHPDQPQTLYPTNSDSALHECANWESLNGWAGERRFDLYRYDELLKPKHGLKYAEDDLGFLNV